MPPLQVLREGVINDPLTLPKLDIIDYGRPSLFGGAWGAIDAINSVVVCGFEYLEIKMNLCAYPEQPGFPDWSHVGDHEEIGRLYWNMFKSRFPDGTLRFHDSPDFSGTINFDGFNSNFRGDIGKVGPMAFYESIITSQPGDLWITVFGNRQVILSATVNAYVLRLFRGEERYHPSILFNDFLATIGYHTNFTLQESIGWLVERKVWSQEKADAFTRINNITPIQQPIPVMAKLYQSALFD